MPLTRRYDLDFSVPYTHRLRFTHDVLDAEAKVLLDLLEPHEQAVRVMAFVDDALVETGAVERLEAMLAEHRDRVHLAAPIQPVSSGEASKNDPRVVDSLLAAFDAAGLDRRNYILVLGGGAVLDAVGFAAAVAHRGLRLVRVPTTTLAQADSGVGVKNAINRFGKKNWMGTFAVPWGVINDATLLTTLPDRDFCCGFSEAVKVSLLKDAAWFDRLCRDAPLIARRDPQASQHAIQHSAYWHLMHITRGGDPFETREARPLDFGHWSAHRLETLTDFSLRHGEAVGLGLAIDCVYSTLAPGPGLDPADADRVLDCLRDLRLPLTHPVLARPDEILRGMEEFRQHLGGRLTLTMLRSPGHPVDVHEIDPEAMREAIRRVGTY